MTQDVGSTRPRARRWRRAAVVAASAVMLSSVVSAGAAGGAPRPRFQPCPEPFPVSDLAEGMRATGLTVERGTTPERFTATIVGVLDDGIAPDLDMILAEVDSPALQRAGGVWAGMSGSPVYARDGRLIGAVSYILGVPGTVAGITPAADMKELLDRPGPASEPAETVELSAALREEVVESGAATSAQAAAGMQRLPVPLAVSGLSQSRLDAVADRFQEELPGTRLQAASAAPAAPPGSPSAIVPGGNFAAAISYGDLTAAGIGTTTAVCTVGGEDLALAFGHPFEHLGATSLSVHPATALYVQPDTFFGPSKVANPGPVVGTLDQDRVAGIRGRLGSTPPAIDLTSTITSADDGTSRSGTTRVNVQQYLSLITFNHLVANFDRVADRLGGGTIELGWVITGTRASGEPFTVDVANRYAHPGDVSFLCCDDLLSALTVLDGNRFERVEITGVELTGSISSRYTQYTLDEVQVRQPDGSYVPAPAGAPIPVEAGSELGVRVVLVPHQDPAGVRSVDLTLDVPADAAGALGTVDVTGGAGVPTGTPRSFDQLVDQLNGQATNDAVTAALNLDTQPAAPVDSAREVVDQVVVGDGSFGVEVVEPTEAP